MNDVRTGQDGTHVHQILEDDRMCLGHMQPFIGAGKLVQEPLCVDGDFHLHAGGDLVIALAHIEVVQAEGGGGVNAAGTGIQGDVVAQDDEGIPIHKGMIGGHVFELVPKQGAYRLILSDAGILHDAVHQIGGHDEDLAIGLDQRVLQLGIEADGHVAGQSPGGGRPDDEVHLVQIAVLCQLALVIMNLELDVNGGDGVISIFHLSFCQSGLAGGAPVDGLEPLVDIAFFCHCAEHLDLLGFKFRLQGDVGMLPIANAPQAAELFPLTVEEIQGKVPALVPEFWHGHGVALDALLLNGGLDGHTVGVPARNIRRIVAGHILVADDHILEDLIHGGANVNIPVGIGRAIVEDKRSLILVPFHHLTVQILAIHFFQHPRFPLCQLGTHREVGLGQIDGLVIISHGYYCPFFSVSF